MLAVLQRNKIAVETRVTKETVTNRVENGANKSCNLVSARDWWKHEDAHRSAVQTERLKSCNFIKRATLFSKEY